MVTPDTLSIWLKEQAWPLGIIFILVAVAFVILKLSATSRHRSLSRQRSAVTEQTFVDNLAQFNFDPVITGATYRYLQQVQGIRFPILSTDALDEDLGMDSDDVDQTLRELLRSLQREETPGLRHEHILTVEDLVRHVQASPRIKKSVAA
jgi:hypothetical protein